MRTVRRGISLLELGSTHAQAGEEALTGKQLFAPRRRRVGVALFPAAAHA